MSKVNKKSTTCEIYLNRISAKLLIRAVMVDTLLLVLQRVIGLTLTALTVSLALKDKRMTFLDCYRNTLLQIIEKMILFLINISRFTEQIVQYCD